MSVRRMVLFDAECAYCRGFVRLLSRLDQKGEFYLLPYDDAEAQRLLKEQFGSGFGFSMYLFDRDEVCWGQEAARKIVRALSLPNWLSQIAFHLYPAMVKAVSNLTGRTRRVCGPECVDSRSASTRRLCVETLPGVRDELAGAATPRRHQ